MVMCLVAASFGVASLYLGGFAPAKALGSIWWTWWLGDMTGALTAGSLILTWSVLPTYAWGSRRLAEAGLLLALVVLLGVVIFGLGPASIDVPPPLAYLIIPVLVWATFRFGLHGAATGCSSSMGSRSWARLSGPSVRPAKRVCLHVAPASVHGRGIAVTALVMAAMLNERHRAETKVKHWERRQSHRLARDHRQSAQQHIAPGEPGVCRPSRLHRG